MSPKPTIRQLRVVCIIYRADGCRVIWEFKDEGTIRLAKGLLWLAVTGCRTGYSSGHIGEISNATELSSTLSFFQLNLIPVLKRTQPKNT